MFTSTFGTLLFFASTAISAGTVAKQHIIKSHDSSEHDIRLKIQMTRNDFENVRGVSCYWPDSPKEEYHPVNVDVLPVAQEALRIWTMMLKMKQSARNFFLPHDCIFEPSHVDYPKTQHIDITRNDILGQFETASVWIRKPTKDLETLLVIREIGPNLYEFAKIGIDEKSFLHKFKYCDADRATNLRFVYDGIGEKRLTEISILFAQQRIKRLQHQTVSSNSRDRILEKSVELKSVQKDLDGSIEKLQIDLLEQQESNRKAAIQREIQEGKLREEMAVVTEKCTRWQSEVGKLNDDIESLRDEKKEVDDRLTESMIRENDLEARNAEIQRELDSERNLHDAQLDEQHQAAVEAEQKLREKAEGIDHWIMICMFIGGGILVFIGFIIFQLARRTYNEMYDHMEYELNEQLKWVKEPHPLVPGYPSAHAHRLGVHEHPAVRDVFGMKEPWDVTPGEGFHVARITKRGRTPGTTRSGNR